MYGLLVMHFESTVRRYNTFIKCFAVYQVFVILCFKLKLCCNHRFADNSCPLFLGLFVSWTDIYENKNLDLNLNLELAALWTRFRWALVGICTLSLILFKYIIIYIKLLHYFILAALKSAIFRPWCVVSDTECSPISVFNTALDNNTENMQRCGETTQRNLLSLQHPRTFQGNRPDSVSVDGKNCFPLRFVMKWLKASLS